MRTAMTVNAPVASPKISILVSDLSKQGAGRWGGAVRTFLLAQALERIGVTVKIYGFVFGDEPCEPTVSDVPIITVPGEYYPGFIGRSRALLKQLDTDIIYALRPKPTTLGLALWHKRRTGCRVILDIDDWELSWHGGDGYRYRPSLRQLAQDTLKPRGALRYPDHPLYLRWMESRVSQADAVTVHTQFLQTRFGGVKIPNGKDTELFNPEAYDPQLSRQAYGLSDYRILMFPGAPRPYKGIEDVLLALDRLDDRDLRLVIVGGSPYDDYDQQLMQRWGRWIIQLPPQPVTKMPFVVAGADIIVVPQRETPAALAQFPLKLTDGMSMAKPILATRVGDIPEILQDSGYLVEPEAPEAIAQQIRWILAHPEEAQQRGALARKRCIEHYSIEAMSGLLSDVVRSLQSS